MKKTYKEKYYELKKEKEYLEIINQMLCDDYSVLEFEFTKFKKDLKEKQIKEEKRYFIFFIIFLISTICLFLSLLFL